MPRWGSDPVTRQRKRVFSSRFFHSPLISSLSHHSSLSFAHKGHDLSKQGGLFCSSSINQKHRKSKALNTPVEATSQADPCSSDGQQALPISPGPTLLVTANTRCGNSVCLFWCLLFCCCLLRDIYCSFLSRKRDHTSRTRTQQFQPISPVLRSFSVFNLNKAILVEYASVNALHFKLCNIFFSSFYCIYK